MFKISREFLKDVARVPVIIKPNVDVERNRPLVILSSWAGAQEKTLTEYAKMYQKFGCPSMQIGVDLTKKKGLNALASQQTYWDTDARGLFTDIMRDHFDEVWREHPDLIQRKVVVHSFSNNGIQTWCNVRDLLDHPVGFIFDSGPSNPINPDIPGKIFRANNPNAPMFQKLTVSAIGNLGYAASHLILPFKNDFLYPVYLVRMVPELMGESPSLILAAADDIICGPTTVKAEHDRIIRYGKSNCQMHILNGGHCTMLRDDRKNYENYISAFIDETVVV